MSIHSGRSMAALPQLQRLDSSQSTSARPSSEYSETFSSYEDLTPYTGSYNASLDDSFNIRPWTDSRCNVTSEPATTGSYPEAASRSSLELIDTTDDKPSVCRICVDYGVQFAGELISTKFGMKAPKDSEVIGIEPDTMAKRLGRKHVVFEQLRWCCQNSECRKTWYTYRYWFASLRGDKIMQWKRHEDQFFVQLKGWVKKFLPFRFITPTGNKSRRPLGRQPNAEYQPPGPHDSMQRPPYPIRPRESIRSSYDILADSQLTIVPAALDEAPRLSQDSLNQLTNHVNPDNEFPFPVTSFAGSSEDPWTIGGDFVLPDTPQMATEPGQPRLVSEISQPSIRSGAEQPHIANPSLSKKRLYEHDHGSEHSYEHEHTHTHSHHPSTLAAAAPTVSPTGQVEIPRLLPSSIPQQFKRNMNYQNYLDNRKRGACPECRAAKRKCPADHPKSKKNNGRGKFASTPTPNLSTTSGSLKV